MRPTTEFKSTWLTASLETLRARGHFDRYVANLDREHHDAVLHAISGNWLPVNVCLAHYRACDALHLTTAEQMLMGRGVLSRLQKTLFSVAFRVAREAGVTPWPLLKTFPAEFEKQWRGGACGIFRIGPKDARMELIGFPAASISYARVGLRGLALGLCELVCARCYVHDVAEGCDESSLAYRIAWA